MDKLELAWAAGFFDGEGYARLRTTQRPNGKYRHAVLAVAQIDIRPLERFQNAVLGLGKINGPYGPYPSQTKNSSPQYRWETAKFEHVQAVVALLWNFLSEPKKEQILKSIPLKKRRD